MYISDPLKGGICKTHKSTLYLPYLRLEEIPTRLLFYKNVFSILAHCHVKRFGGYKDQFAFTMLSKKNKYLGSFDLQNITYKINGNKFLLESIHYKVDFQNLECTNICLAKFAGIS